MEEDKKIGELESKKLDDTQAEDAAGGVRLVDLYKKNPKYYAEYGITWENTPGSKDKYSIYGVSITALEAEIILDESLRQARQLSKEELHNIGIKGF